MPGASISRLTLEVPGWSEVAARRLVSAVVDGLATAGLPDASGSLSTLRVNLTVGANVQPDELARQIVVEISRQLDRLP
jgi:hypothetical protein